MAQFLGPEAIEYVTAVRERLQARVSPLQAEMHGLGEGNIFPNLSWIKFGVFHVFGLFQWHPKGPGEIEVWQTAFFDSAAPQSIKDFARLEMSQENAAAGIFGQDDGENFEQITESARGSSPRPATSTTPWAWDTTARFRRRATPVAWARTSRNRTTATSTATGSSSMTTPGEHKWTSTSPTCAATSRTSSTARPRCSTSSATTTGLALFTEDVRYWMPITETREVRQPRDHVPGEWALMEEDSRFLAKRMERLAGGLAHAERARSRIRRFISNVLVTPGPDDDLVAECNFIVFQSRRANSEQFFVGSRRDRIVTSGESWKIAERTVLSTTGCRRAISIFF